MKLSENELIGNERTHVQQMEQPRFAAHPEAVKAFMAMRDAALKDGIDLLPFSSYRDVKTQIRIWNKKFLGQKPLYNMAGEEIEYSTLSREEIVDAILGWSALPGASRHHWGSEIDVVDGAVMTTDYQVQLLPSEVQEGGIFYHLHQWLDENIHQFGFFRPYAKFQGGMFSEPWHLSFARVSVPAQQSLSLAIIERFIRSINIEGKDLVLKQLPSIFDQHITNISLPDHLRIGEK